MEAAYGNDLISLGVAGFRLDAAKSIPPADISNVESRLSKTIYITQEVIWGPNQAVNPSDYVGNGDVMEYNFCFLFGLQSRTNSALQVPLR